MTIIDLLNEATASIGVRCTLDEHKKEIVLESETICQDKLWRAIEEVWIIIKANPGIREFVDREKLGVTWRVREPLLARNSN